MPQRKTDSEFKQEVYDLVGDEYTFLEPYTGVKDKIEVKHNLCGYSYRVTPSNFLRGRRCPQCFGSKKKTTEQFKQEVKELAGNEYSVLSEYKNAQVKIRIKHNTCGTVYEVTPNNFLGGNRCPNCFGNERKTTEQFKQEIKELVGNEYTVLSEYKNAQVKIRIKHNKCGYAYEVTPQAFLNGRRCPKCSNHLPMTDSRYKQKVQSLVGDEYTVLNSYTDPRTDVAIRHNKCGYVFHTQPYNFLSGTRCPKCAGNLAKTTSQFKQEIYNLVGTEYTVLSEYKGSSKKVQMKHNKCGYTWWVQASSFLGGNRCPNCNGGISKSPDEFEQEFNDLAGDEYTLLSPYKRSNSKIKVKHNKCGYIYWVTPSSFMHGRRCPNCFGRQRKTTDQFKQEVYDLVGEDYTVLSEYKNSKTKIKLKHNLCGQVFDMTPKDFLFSGHRCPWCFQHGSSHGNSWIAKSLKKNKILYKGEYKFDGCKDKRKLPFDFYLPELNICIEYDGRQHYDSDSKYYSKTQVYHDHLKNQYCKDHGIKLVRMRWDQYPDYASVNTFIKQELINNPSN